MASGSSTHIHIIYDVEGWAYYHRATALARRAPAGFVVTCADRLPDTERLAQLDLVLLLNYHLSRQIRAALRGYKARLLISINIGWPHNRELVQRAADQCDALVFVNRSSKRRFAAEVRPSFPMYQISNGVDVDTFRRQIPLADRPARVLWVGSNFHARNKGYELLSDLRPQIEAAGWHLDLRLVDSTRAPHTPAEMARWYNSGQVYLVASESEGTPNPALEAAACGTVVVGTPVGNMPELLEDGVNGIVIERSERGILDGLGRARPRLDELASAMNPVIAQWSWDVRACEYYAAFRDLIAKTGDLPAGRATSDMGVS